MGRPQEKKPAPAGGRGWHLLVPGETKEAAVPWLDPCPNYFKVMRKILTSSSSWGLRMRPHGRHWGDGSGRVAFNKLGVGSTRLLVI